MFTFFKVKHHAHFESFEAPDSSADCKTYTPWIVELIHCSEVKLVMQYGIASDLLPIAYFK